MGVLVMLVVDGAITQEMDSHTTPMVAFPVEFGRDCLGS